jgi:cytochrome c2
LSPAPEFISSDKRSGAISWTNSSLKPCLTCHHYGLTNPTHTAPSLTRIFSREIASDNFQYSKALSSKTGKWTAQTLTAYLLDPQAFAQGSTMSYQVESEELAHKITEILLTLDNISE